MCNCNISIPFKIITKSKKGENLNFCDLKYTNSTLIKENKWAQQTNRPPDKTGSNTFI